MNRGRDSDGFRAFSPEPALQDKEVPEVIRRLAAAGGAIERFEHGGRGDPAFAVEHGIAEGLFHGGPPLACDPSCLA
jgi:hypothetical protein